MNYEGVNSIDYYHSSNSIQTFYPNDELLSTIQDMEMTKDGECSFERGCETAENKFFLGDDIDEDGHAWSTKKIEEWSQGDTTNWLMSAASHMGQPYCSIQQTLAIPGIHLINLTKQDFIFHDRDYGEKLYDLLNSQRLSNSLPNFSIVRKNSENYRTQTGSTTVSDAESEDSVEVSPKEPGPGRPRGLKPKKTPTSQGKLWEYIRDLLKNPETCPSLIRWEDYSQGKFRFVRSEEVAKRWGARNGNTEMTYGKMSRAMRYHYENKIFLKSSVKKSPLVYQFGPNAKGWQTDNPNFHR